MYSILFSVASWGLLLLLFRPTVFWSKYRILKGPQTDLLSPLPKLKMGWGGLPCWTTFEANLMLKLIEKIQKSNHPSICSLSLLKLSKVREPVGCVRPRKKPQSNSNHSNQSYTSRERIS